MILLVFSALFVCSFSQNITQTPLMTWQQFKHKYNYTYNSTEDPYRQKIFQANLTQLIANPCSYCGVTKYFANTQHEIQAGRNLFLPLNIKELAENTQNQSDSSYIITDTKQVKLKLGDSSSASSTLDWRTTGAVTPAQAQGTCGTCWSFATVGMCESSLILQGRALNTDIYRVHLSQQYLLKCTSGSSCSGGYLENAIDKALKGGLPYASQFSYNPTSNNLGLCSTKDLIKISNKTRISKYRVNDNTIITMLQDGPIVGAVSATGWQKYSSGVYTCSPNAQVNHAVLIVGYTPTYWIIKNSWGTDFGDNGFIYVSRDPQSNCAIGTAVHMLGQMQISWSIFCLIILALLSLW